MSAGMNLQPVEENAMNYGVELVGTYGGEARPQISRMRSKIRGPIPFVNPSATILDVSQNFT